MDQRRYRSLACGLAIAAALLAVPAWAQAADAGFPADQVARGSQLYADNCEACHGPRMKSPGGEVFDLRTFPADQRQRFLDSVGNGKRNMPPWRSMLSPQDIESLFAYVMAGEPR